MAEMLICHFPKNIDLKFSFPFFGRRVDRLVVSTGGALLMDAPAADEGTANGKTAPSHVAPFLTGLPPSQAEGLYHDFGEFLLLF